MLHLSTYLVAHHYTGLSNSVCLRDCDVPKAMMCLNLDQDAFFVNALVSFAGCCHSIKRSNYSWALIQSYYSLYYMAKALLADRGYSIHYDGRTPFEIKISKGEYFKKRKGNSHEVMLNAYKAVYNRDPLLCDTIDGIHVVDWFNKTREEVNYKTNPFTDPNPPSGLFKYEGNLREYIAQYREDFLYSTDAEHAYVAYIMRMIDVELTKYEDSGRVNQFLTNDVLKHLKANMCDEKGAYTFLIKEIESIGV